MIDKLTRDSAQADAWIAGYNMAVEYVQLSPERFDESKRPWLEDYLSTHPQTGQMTEEAHPIHLLRDGVELMELIHNSLMSRLTLIKRDIEEGHGPSMGVAGKITEDLLAHLSKFAHPIPKVDLSKQDPEKFLDDAHELATKFLPEIRNGAEGIEEEDAQAMALVLAGIALRHSDLTSLLAQTGPVEKELKDE